MSIDAETIARIAQLARLRPQADSIPTLTQDLNRVLNLFETLSQVPIEGIQPLFHPGDATLRTRADAVTETDQRERLLAIAPEVAGDLLLVPKVLDASS
jgi:aspartyl-tRNA(Asn)/glutamyl-tRNA(Gln) amidotransferase subunit C